MSETPKRFTLRGRLHSVEELQNARKREEHEQTLVRRPGEGLHEYVRRVTNSEYQIVSTQYLNDLQDQNSRRGHEIHALRTQLILRRERSSDQEHMTAAEIADQEMRTRRRALMGQAIPVPPVGARGLAVDTEDRLMVGGPMDGRVLQFRADVEHYQFHETEDSAIQDFGSPVSRRMTTRVTVHTYFLLRRYDTMPLMIGQDLLNAPLPIQDSHVFRAMREAGLL